MASHAMRQKSPPLRHRRTPPVTYILYSVNYFL
jgi:hypothetical protein